MWSCSYAFAPPSYLVAFCKQPSQWPAFPLRQNRKERLVHGLTAKTREICSARVVVFFNLVIGLSSVCIHSKTIALTHVKISPHQIVSFSSHASSPTVSIVHYKTAKYRKALPQRPGGELLFSAGNQAYNSPRGVLAAQGAIEQSTRHFWRLSRPVRSRKRFHADTTVCGKQGCTQSPVNIAMPSQPKPVPGTDICL